MNGTVWLVWGGVFVLVVVIVMSIKKWHQHFIDSIACKPSGWIGQKLYRAPKSHYKSFEHLLEKLDLTGDGAFLDICCGGGAMLERALKIVPKDAGLDRSIDMISLSTDNSCLKMVKSSMSDQSKFRRLPPRATRWGTWLIYLLDDETLCGADALVLHNALVDGAVGKE